VEEKVKREAEALMDPQLAELIVQVIVQVTLILHHEAILLQAKARWVMSEQEVQQYHQHAIYLTRRGAVVS
jgi:hypothetical protein